MTFMKRLLLTSLTLNILWTFLGSQIGRLFHKDLGGIIIAIGFLVIYSSTYFIQFDKSKKSIHNFLMLTLTIIVIFLIASFIPPFLFINGNSDLSIFGFTLCSSTLAFIGIVSIVGHYTIISNKTNTIVVGSVLTAIITFLFFRLTPENLDIDKMSKVVNPMALGFCIWQVLTTFLIGRSINSLKSLQPTNGFVQVGQTE